jgi:hypothetical protein
VEAIAMKKPMIVTHIGDDFELIALGFDAILI